MAALGLWEHGSHGKRGVRWVEGAQAGLLSTAEQAFRIKETSTSYPILGNRNPAAPALHALLPSLARPHELGQNTFKSFRLKKEKNYLKPVFLSLWRRAHKLSL